MMITLNWGTNEDLEKFVGSGIFANFELLLQTITQANGEVAALWCSSELG
jgi:hypothetical protein